MEIRDLVTNDLDAALALNNAAVPALNELDMTELTRLFGEAAFALAAGPVGFGLEGFCLAFDPGAPYESLNYRWFSARYESFTYLDRIVVDPNRRGSGIGAALYAELERRIGMARPWLLCEVNVRPLNAGSLRFHHRIGFSEVGQQDTDGGNKTVSLLAKRLAPRTG
jgi:predicted GNAT superfamily acetyltransferase